MKKWKQFDSKIRGKKKLEYDVKIKDIINIFKLDYNLKFSFIRYVIPIDLEISIPTVFHWNLGGTYVNILGDWDSWSQKIPLNRSGTEFTTIIPLSPGRFRYNFFVDGQSKYAINHKQKKDLNGNIYNIASIQHFEKNPELQDSFSDTENIHNLKTSVISRIFFEETKKEPPIVPLYLTELFDKNLMIKKNSPYCFFLNLPIQIHVLFNHLFFLSYEKIPLNSMEKLPSLKARINGKILNLILCSRKKKKKFFNINPVKNIINKILISNNHFL